MWGVWENRVSGYTNNVKNYLVKLCEQWHLPTPVLRVVLRFFVGEALFFKILSIHCASRYCDKTEKKRKEKRKKEGTKEHSTVLLCRSGIKHSNISSLQRPPVHFLIQSQKLGYLWACSPDPIPATCAHTCMCVCIHTLNLSSKVVPFGNDERHFQKPRCRENTCMGFPSG